MRDPHVEALEYRLEHGDDISYDDPDPVEFGTEKFVGRLEDGELLVTMREHFERAEEARRVVDPFLRAWELDDRLRGRKDEISFKYLRARVIDRNPPAAGSGIVVPLEGISVGVSADVAALRVGRRSYPAPPFDFLVTADVETMWQRYEGYLEGKEPLLSMGYFCLTVIQSLAGSRGGATERFRVERDVLNTVGELTSSRGDGRTARKANQMDGQRPLSKAEERWLERALKLLIARVGEVAGGSQVDTISLDDLPSLEKKD